MSSIGDVSARLGLNFQQYVQGVTSAAQATGGLNAETRQLEQIMIPASDVVQFMEGVTQGAAEEMERLGVGANFAAEATERVAKQSAGAVRGMNLIRGASSALATTALGLPGALGQVAQGLLFFTAGSATVAGIVGGIGAIALAYHALTKGSREARAEIDELIKKGIALAEANLSIPDQMKGIQDKVDQLVAARKAFIVDVVGPIRAALAEQTGQGFGLSAFNADQQETLRNFDKAIAGYRALRNETGSLPRELTISANLTSAVATNLERARVAVDSITKKMAGMNKDLMDAVKAPLETPDAPALKPFRIPLEETNKNLRDYARMGADLGAQFTQQLTGTILRGKKDFAGSLGDLFMSAIEDVIAMLIKKKIFESILGAITGGGSSILGLIPGANIIAGITGAIGFSQSQVPSMSLQVNVPPAPSDPRTLARDRQWQEALKESMHVAYQQGFRPAVS